MTSSGIKSHRATARLVFTLVLLSQALSAQSADGSSTTPITLFVHSDTSRYWVSGQSNIIVQGHPSFSAAYSGTNSLRSAAEHSVSNLATLHLGFVATRNTEIFVDVESASGGGISDALGLAGFTNLDVVRNPALGAKPYLARAMIRQIVPLGSKTEEATRQPFFLATALPERRLEFRFGKMGIADFFDQNDVGSDSHFQFMNWTVDNNGAYDYAADTRGYTIAVLAEYHDRGWVFRFSEALMPQVANGVDLEWNLRRAHADNLELELHPQVLGGTKPTTVRLLSFINHANMGGYKDAIADFLAGKTPRPEITDHPFRTTVKYGFGINLQQSLTSNWRVYSRWGWNEGQHESYAYTEVDETIQIGSDYSGQRWHRRFDKVGAVFVSNGISRVHQQYLALGGRGFLLGDGALNYGRENIVESYYNAHLWRGIFAGFDLQHINDAGYNRDRGPVWVPGFRFHLEL